MVSLSTSFTLNSSSETSNLPVFPPLIAFSIADVIEFCHSSPVFLKPRALSSILKTGGSRLSACRCIRSFSSYFSLLGLYLEQLLFSPQCCIFPQNWLYNPTFNSYRAIATSFFYTASHFPCHPFFLIPSLSFLIPRLTDYTPAQVISLQFRVILPQCTLYSLQRAERPVQKISCHIHCMLQSLVQLVT